MKNVKMIFVISIIFLGATNLFSQQYKMITVGQHDDEVLGVFVNEDDTKVATCSLDETIKIWDIPGQKLIKTLKGHLGQVNNLSFSGNDKR
jgi:WD40 repeat protein